MRRMMTAPARPGGQQRMVAAPAEFNRLARLTRQQVGSVAYGANINNRFLDLPKVGYHYRVSALSDLTLTSAGSVSGRFLGGFVGSNTNRFMAPLGLVRAVRYALNVSSPIYNTDGWGNFLVQLLQTRGANPFIQVLTGDAGYQAKEKSNFVIYNATDDALVKPDGALVASKSYRLRMNLLLPLTFGEAATVGLVPCQDIRIAPQVSFDFGGLADLLSVPADATGDPSGNFNIIVDYFTVPGDAVRPDTSFVCQTRQDVQSIAGVGVQVYRPQIGGVIMRVINAIYNGSKLVDPAVISKARLKVQQGIVLEDREPRTMIADELRWTGKRIPDGVFVWDHTTGFGDPTLVSLRDRIASADYTQLDYELEIASGTTITATAEWRAYLQQMVPLPMVGVPGG